jgi:triacylglycerol lipase
MPAAPQQTPLPSLPETPSTSELARWQRTWIALAALASLIWFAWMWPRSPVLTLVVLLLGAWSHAIVLAMEFACAAWVNRADSVAAPAPAQRLGAWIQETSLTPGIFLWRQPFRWRDLPDSVLEPGVVSTGPAVVLIHGFVCNRGFWAPWMRVLGEAGIPFTSVNLEPVFGSIDAGISWVEGAVARAERLGTQPPILVCHSMGGLAARAWLAHAAGNRARVGRVITIGSPHHGTWLARWSRVANGRQMRQRSTWLQALADRESAAGRDAAYRQFTCFYSNADHIVFPVSTALLPGADNRHVPGAPHVALAFHPTVMRESLAMVLPAGISSEARTAS